MVRKSEIQKQITDLKREIDLLKSQDFRLEIQLLKTHMNSLRGFVNRRMERAIEFKEKEEFKSPDGLDGLR